jgi:hypothetical protein
VDVPSDLRHALLTVLTMPNTSDVVAAVKPSMLRPIYLTSCKKSYWLEPVEAVSGHACSNVSFFFFLDNAPAEC